MSSEVAHASRWLVKSAELFIVYYETVHLNNNLKNVAINSSTVIHIIVPVQVATTKKKERGNTA